MLIIVHVIEASYVSFRGNSRVYLKGFHECDDGPDFVCSPPLRLRGVGRMPPIYILRDAIRNIIIDKPELTLHMYNVSL